MVNEHQWKLVGPWYRWKSEEDPFSKGFSRPILQKYPDSQHVDEFLVNPQHSLKYLAEDNSPSNRRKIYLDTHSRFYLIVCSLHCDAQNFPKVNRDKVCEAGFVIRRRKTQVPDEIKADVDKLLTNITFQKTKLKRVQTKQQQFKSKAGGIGITNAVNIAIVKSKQSAQQKYTLKLEQSQNNLKKLLQDFGVEPDVQAWHQTVSGIGLWKKLDDETPESISEQIYPLYPLIPDSNNDIHPSGHQTLFYGLLPVGSSDTDQLGNPQFDDRSVFEVRCFVRRHKPLCPKSNERNDCKGEIVWSRSTENYQLASHFDLIGTGNRMTTVQAPDLNDLKDQILDPNFNIGQGMGLAVSTPRDSNLPINLDGDNQPQPIEGELSGPPSICFFAIPLITIIALFLLNLFLPIVVFLFGLWFLLSLKLCILPTLSIDLALEFKFDVEGRLGIDIEADLAAELEIDENFIKVLDLLQPKMRDSFINRKNANDSEVYTDLARIAVEQTTDFSNSGIAEALVKEINAMIKDDPELAQKTSASASLPNPNDRLQYYQTKQLQEVLS